MQQTLESIGWRLARALILISGIVLIIGPMFLVMINTLKTQQEAALNFFGLPTSFNLDNYRSLLTNHLYWVHLRTSVIITVASIICVVVLVPAASYAIVRNFEKKYYKFVFFFLLMGLFIPAQVIILPVVMRMSSLNMMTPTGLIMLYATFSLTQGVFLFSNYLRSLPTEIEESARVDGCSVLQTFIHVVLHLTKPIIATLIVINALWFWNDFMLPLLILNRARDMWTLPIFQFNFRTEYSFNYTMAFTAYTMSMLPMLIVYCLAQKYIIKGLTAGAIKG